MRIRCLCFLVLLVGGFAGCGDGPTAPYRLPDPDTSLDPALVTEPALAFGCGHWWRRPAPPDDSAVVLDVSFNYPALPPQAPLPAHYAAVRDNGGYALSAFHLNVLRIWIRARDVPRLAASSQVNQIYWVANERRFDWLVGVLFKPGYQYSSADTDAFVALGGRITAEFPALRTLYGIIPDRSLPTLRSNPNLDWAVDGADFVYCGT